MKRTVNLELGEKGLRWELVPKGGFDYGGNFRIGGQTHFYRSILEYSLFKEGELRGRWKTSQVP